MVVDHVSVYLSVILGLFSRIKEGVGNELSQYSDAMTFFELSSRTTGALFISADRAKKRS